MLLISRKIAIMLCCLGSMAIFNSACKEEAEKDKKAAKKNTQAVGAQEQNASASNNTCVNANDVSCRSRLEVNGDAKIVDVSFKGSRGDDVPAQLYLPHGEQASASPGILLQYGLGASKSTSLVQQVAKAFMDHGYAVLVMDVPGRGERVAPGGKITNISNVLDHDLFRWFVADYKVALDYMLTRQEIDAQRIAYVGASWGAITGFSFVARAKNIKAMVSVVGGGGFFGVVPPELDPVNNIANIAPRPILLINALRDQVILRPFADALHSQAGNNATKVWLDTDHTLAGYDMNDFANRVLKYLDQKLR